MTNVSNTGTLHYRWTTLGQGVCEKEQLQLCTSLCLALEKFRLIEGKIKKKFKKIALYVI
jgi:hypothetical protein